MNRVLYIAFVIVLVISLSLGGYYLYIVLKAKDNIVSDSTARTWQEASAQIPVDCKGQMFSGQDAVDAYVVKLFKAIDGNITYNTKIKAFVPSSDSELFYINDVGQAGKASCLVVWVGDMSGKGKVTYELVSGKLKILPITDYFLPSSSPTSASAPIASPSPIP